MGRHLISGWCLLWACSVFPDEAVLPDTGGAGGTSGGRGGVAGSPSGGFGGSLGGSGDAGGFVGGAAGSAGTAGTQGGSSGDGGSAIGGQPSAAGSSGAPLGGSSGEAGIPGAGGSTGDAGSAGVGGAGGGSEGGAGGAIPCANPTTATLPATAVAWLDESAPTARHGDASTLRIASVVGARAHTLVQFDLSTLSARPAQVTLELMLASGVAESRLVAVHRLTSPWVENQVSWRRAGPATDWTLAGGDFEASATDTAPIQARAPAGAVFSWEVTADVANLIEQGSEGFGWLVRDAGVNAPPLEFAVVSAPVTPSLVVVTCP